MASVRALTLFPLILSSIAQPVSPTPRDDPSTFIQDTNPLVDNPNNAKWPMDGDEMFGDSFAIPYLDPESSSSLPSPSPSQSMSHSPSISASASASATPTYTPWEHSAETPLPWAHSPKTPLPWAYTPVYTPVNTPVNTPVSTPVSTEPVPEHPTPVSEQPAQETNPTPTSTETDHDDNGYDDSFDAMWDILSGRIRNVLNSDELTLWD